MSKGNWTRKIIALLLLLAVPLMLTQTARGQNTRYVNIEDFAFHPKEILVDKSQDVTWTNNDEVIYTLWFVHSENQSTHLLFDPILPGETWQHTFGIEANLTYYCFERLWIIGNIEIIRLLGDVNDDGIVDIWDLTIIGLAYGSFIGQPRYDADADINSDGRVELKDLAIVAYHYGETDPLSPMHAVVLVVSARMHAVHVDIYHFTWFYMSLALRIMGINRT